ncbi:hypothetical protein ACIFOT_11920 [Neobacillus sp. NRS-1170]|uniref:hypothetical protein n=1 Tax=Neobacillus sp. NRS-1170 TaxID=3233898 RepID=UPI003D2B7F4E
MIFRSILHQLLLWLIATIIFLFLLFLPRTAVYSTGTGGTLIGAEYDYSFEAHIKQFKDFIQYVKENKGLERCITAIPLRTIFGAPLKKVC